MSMYSRENQTNFKEGDQNLDKVDQLKDMGEETTMNVLVGVKEKTDQKTRDVPIVVDRTHRTCVEPATENVTDVMKLVTMQEHARTAKRMVRKKKISIWLVFTFATLCKNKGVGEELLIVSDVMDKVIMLNHVHTSKKVVLIIAKVTMLHGELLILEDSLVTEEKT